MTPVPDDLLLPFQIESTTSRGRLVRFGPLIETVLGQHDYPAPVAEMLGEMLVLTALVSGALKFEGVLSLQVKGSGPIGTMVADITDAGAMRGYAQYDSERLDAAMADPTPSEPVPRLFGTGYLAFTVDQGGDTDRYQGIVELHGATLADCAHKYFRQSEQLDAAVKLAAGQVTPEDGGAPRWRAGGLMVQRLAFRGWQWQSGDAPAPVSEDDWRRAVIMMGSSTREELLDPALHPHDLLFRLFHEDGVRVFDPQPLRMECRCSHMKVVRMLQSFPKAEIEELMVDETLDVKCEFCGRAYPFDRDQFEAMFATSGRPPKREEDS